MLISYRLSDPPKRRCVIAYILCIALYITILKHIETNLLPFESLLQDTTAGNCKVLRSDTRRNSFVEQRNHKQCQIATQLQYVCHNYTLNHTDDSRRKHIQVDYFANDACGSNYRDRLIVLIFWVDRINDFWATTALEQSLIYIQREKRCKSSEMRKTFCF